MKFTIFGAKGFIGSHLADHLCKLGFECFTPERNDASIFGQNLGHIIYCIGLTADFRDKPFETIEAHVCKMSLFLRDLEFDSFLYLSSTRIYKSADNTKEGNTITVNPLDQSDLYNISKLMGESICFSSLRPNIRVARLSNVYGKDYQSQNFLTDIIHQSVVNKFIGLKVALDSSKDYVSIQDVVSLLYKISVSGIHNVYNVASGYNTSNRAILKKLQQLTECEFEVANHSPNVTFPEISIARIQEEFSFSSTPILDSLEVLVQDFRNYIER